MNINTSSRVALLALSAILLGGSSSVYARSASPSTLEQLRETATTVYVDSLSGNDAHQGTQLSPYKTLEHALAHAPEHAIVAIKGEHILTKDLTLTKSVTLYAQDATAKITTPSHNKIMLATKDTTLHIGKAPHVENTSMPAANLIFDKVDIEVSAGTFKMYAGAKLFGASIKLQGTDTKGTILGGEIAYDETAELPYSAIEVSQGATIDTIRTGAFSASASVLYVHDEGSRIHKIEGGTFKNHLTIKSKSGVSAVLISNYGQIGEISGGVVQSLWYAALQVKDGAWIDKISGGNFESSADKNYFTSLNPTYNHFSRFAGLYVEADSYAHKPFTHKTGVGTMSGGSFTGVHAIYMVGSDTQAQDGNGYVHVERIEGGTFTSKALEGTSQNSSVLYAGQVSKIGTISGGTFKGAGCAVQLEGDFGFQLPVPELEEISGGEFKAENTSVINVNQGSLKKISGGAFINYGTSGSAVSVTSRRGRIDEIANGAFQGVDGAIKASSKGSIGVIHKGTFLAQNLTESNSHYFRSLISSENKQKKTSLEPNLTGTEKPRGEGRYSAEFVVDKYEIHEEVQGSNLIMPTYTGVDGTQKEYIVSGYNHIISFRKAKDADAYHNAFVFKRVLYIKSDKSEGMISWKNNDYVDDPSTGYDKTQHTIYALEKLYNNTDEFLDDGFRYLTKQPVLSYDKNTPLGATLSGEVPQQPQEHKPWNYTEYENGVIFKNGEPSESLFLVKGNTGELKAAGYEFVGWNTKADGSGIWLYEDNYVAMPAYSVTLYAQWKKVHAPKPPTPPAPNPPAPTPAPPVPPTPNPSVPTPPAPDIPNKPQENPDDTSSSQGGGRLAPQEDGNLRLRPSDSARQSVPRKDRTIVPKTHDTLNPVLTWGMLCAGIAAFCLSSLVYKKH